ncbi:hypothetical protein [Chromobacterium haemolyticum]|uniref:hypothetical protein n=1 Tax=Chromobacterium haemolyticum TaxID=394935 RepID=UPI0005942A9A|nr:hypothetical protein [Chromobacterium haemolyticum]
MKTLVEMEIKRIPWSSLREIDGNATNIEFALLNLLNCTSAEEAENIYWQLENRIVVQGQLFQAAEFVVPVIIAALFENKARYIKISLLNLLYQIITGAPHEDEIKQGNINLTEKCIKSAREEIFVLYHELINGEKECAKDIIEIIDTDRSRVDYFLDENFEV